MKAGITMVLTYSENRIKAISNNVTWKSSNPISVAVDESGMLTAHGVGSSTITAQINKRIIAFRVKVLQ